MNSLEEYLKEGIKSVEERLQKSAIEPTESAISLINKISDKSLETDAKEWFKRIIHLSLNTQKHGKRFRARLVLIFSWINNLPIETAVSMGAFVEIIQTASLVHDDVVDDADTRRGKSTVRESNGNRFAVLTGDYLLSIALQELSHINCPQLFGLFSEVVSQMTLGEAMELECINNSKRDISHYYSTISLKTASLIAFSVYAPFVVSNQEKNTIELMKSFGLNIGMAFQIIDDVLDFVGPDGKKIFKDVEQGIATLPVILLKIGNIFSQTKDSLMELIRNNSTLEASVERANNHYKLAFEKIRKLSKMISNETTTLIRSISYEMYDRLPEYLQTKDKEQLNVPV